MSPNADYKLADDQAIISDCLTKLELNDFAKEATLTSDCKVLSKLINMLNCEAKRQGKNEVSEALYFSGFIYG